MNEKRLSRRDLLKSGAAVGITPFLKIGSFYPDTKSQSSTMTGLAKQYTDYDALGLAALIAAKQISPRELLNAVRQRVDALNPKLNAFCHLFFDKAEVQIKDRLGTGAFYGVPFALKDVGQYLSGTITSAGSRLFKNDVAGFDSTLASRHKRAGLVIFGKTNCPELGLTNTTESILFGQPQSVEFRTNVRGFVRWRGRRCRKSHHSNGARLRWRRFNQDTCLVLRSYWV